jgi:hypothetical protein
MLPDFDSTPMRGVFFGVEAILYSFTLPQRFWQVTRAIAQSTEIPTAIFAKCRLSGVAVDCTRDRSFHIPFFSNSCKNTWRLEIAPIQTKSAYADF